MRAAFPESQSSIAALLFAQADLSRVRCTDSCAVPHFICRHMLVHRFDSPALFPVGHAAAETDVKYMFFLVSTSTRFHRGCYRARAGKSDIQETMAEVRSCMVS